MPSVAKVVYIAGCTHSGTTLLHRVLGAHSRIVTIGGSKHIPAFSRSSIACSCGASTPLECSFWSQVERDLADSDLTLSGLNLDSPESENFQYSNARLYEAIERAASATVVLDTSRNIKRLRQLHTVSGIDVVPIHLFKEPLRQIGSWKRTGRPFVKCIRKYWEVNAGIERICRRFPENFSLSYEEFCLNTESFVREILRQLSLDYESTILSDWGSNPLHVLGGNRMKEIADSNIRLDESYKRYLNPIETIVTRSSCYHFYKKLSTFKLK